MNECMGSLHINIIAVHSIQKRGFIKSIKDEHKRQRKYEHLRENKNETMDYNSEGECLVGIERSLMVKSMMLKG